MGATGVGWGAQTQAGEELTTKLQPGELRQASFSPRLSS